MTDLLHTEQCSTEPGDAIDLIRSVEGSHLGGGALMLRMWMDGEVAGAVHLKPEQLQALAGAMSRAVDTERTRQSVRVPVDRFSLGRINDPERWRVDPKLEFVVGDEEPFNARDVASLFDEIDGLGQDLHRLTERVERLENPNGRPTPRTSVPEGRR